MALAQTEVHVHFRKRSNLTPVLFREIFWTSNEDMRGLSFRERFEMFIFSWGDAKIRYPHVEVSFSVQDVLDAGMFSSVATSDTPEELHHAFFRIGASAAGNSTFFQPRLYTSDDYDSVSINWPKAYVETMIRFAAEHHTKPFVHGLCQTFLIPTLPDGHTWFCAQFITAILQAGRILDGVNPSEMTGDTIRATLAEFYYASPVIAAGQVLSAISYSQTREVARPTRSAGGTTWKMEDV